MWRFRYKIFGTERKLSLGSFPEVSLRDARKKRDLARAEIIDGIDPVEEKRQRRIEAELAAKIAAPMCWSSRSRATSPPTSSSPPTGVSIIWRCRAGRGRRWRASPGPIRRTR
ncbi:integrase arm-type DNA-binding domain-containing protein [Sphingosinithalassobacter tenebrarum]|uniref:Integrase arm-type DNA-binding domain-containing protein n=1 Tax=Stakelama tenebrarum TaxID=2711215 RepID=A0A6G6Y366_9SPHN|nr:integrase arm-type DNA-binding domain-containing protein [Sphingosinithalassobacter tenebrarum]